MHSVLNTMPGAGVTATCASPGGVTPLRLAVQGGHAELVQFFLSQDANAAEVTDTGDTLLHCVGSTAGDNSDIAGTVRVLLEHGALLWMFNMLMLVHVDPAPTHCLTC